MVGLRGEDNEENKIWVRFGARVSQRAEQRKPRRERSRTHSAGSTKKSRLSSSILGYLPTSNPAGLARLVHHFQATSRSSPHETKLLSGEGKKKSKRRVLELKSTPSHRCRRRPRSRSFERDHRRHIEMMIWCIQLTFRSPRSKSLRFQANPGPPYERVLFARLEVPDR